MTIQEAIQTIQKMLEVYTSECRTLMNYQITALEMAIEALSAQPERKKGEWIKRFDGNEWFWYCTSCKEQWYEDDLYMGGNDFPKYCPNCGRKMKGKG